MLDMVAIIKSSLVVFAVHTIISELVGKPGSILLQKYVLAPAPTACEQFVDGA